MSYIALLRGVNVGGNKKLAMSDLRDFLAELNFSEPRSLLQSGNLIFRGRARSGARLERFLEAEAEKRLNLKTAFFVRTAKEWPAIIAANPFREGAKHDPSHLVVIFLKEMSDAKRVAALQAAIAGREVVRAVGKQLYIVYPDGIGESRLTNTLIDRTLGTRGTGRNWNTVMKLNGIIMNGRNPD